MNTKTKEVLDSLRSNWEQIETSPNDDKWGRVCLDNARPAKMSWRQFAWHLSELSKLGLCRPVGGEFLPPTIPKWGDVLLDPR